MSCLTIEQIYLYLEQELPEAEVKEIEEHLSLCADCQEALAERKYLLSAFDSLPDIPIPSNFTNQVMNQLTPQRLPLGKSLVIAACGAFSMILALLFVFIYSGQSLINLLISLNQSILSGLQNLTVAGAKALKLISLSVRVISQFFEFLREIFSQLTQILSPEAQIFLILATVIFSATAFYGIRRKFLLGEKT